MVQKKTRRQRDIKSKLLAAICMLLVSSIMMVSSTYAWFTLSTAPEVTGITTAVGANGNLEMALQPLNGESTDTNIKSSVGDSTKDAHIKNLTWGNLVDLSNDDFYGLDNIKLYPSALSTETDDTGLKLTANPLQTPSYGADGRVATLSANTITGVYDSTNEAFYESYTATVENVTTTIQNARGVRAVGVASSMTERQLAFRSALSTASSATSQAKRLASQSLNNNGAKLADIAIQHATVTDSTTESYTVEDVNALMTIVKELLGYDTTTGEGTDAVTTHTTGSLEYVETALRQYAVALALNAASDDGYKTAKETVEKAALADINTTNNTVIATGITRLQTAIANVKDAQSKLQTLLNSGKTSFTWDEISDALELLASPSKMQINGIQVNQLNADWTVDVKSGTYTDTDGTQYSTDENGKVLNSKGEVITNMSRLVSSVMKSGINLILGTGAGVYADIADFCGNYSASITIKQISYGGLTVDNLEANMSTQTTVNPTYLDQAYTAVGNYNAGSGGGSSSTPISDFYGYIIDLAFRTNVADSNLQLQTRAVDRIYSDNTANDATMGGGASMSFKSTSTAFSDTAVKSLMGCIRVVFFDTDSLKIVGYARLDPATSTTDASTGEVTMDLVMTDAAGSAATDATIMPLTQNTVHELSVLVYLDGETITNKDVANATESMKGSMNLQFSSSATLVPMEYTNLKNGTGDTTTTTPTVTTTTLTNVSVTGDTTVSVTKAVYDGSNIAIQLTGYTNQAVTIQVGDGAAVSVTPITADGVTGITYAAEDVAADTAIVINVTAAG